VNGILNSNYTEFKNGNSRAFAMNLRQLYRELMPWLEVDKHKDIDEITPIKNAFAELAALPKHKKDAIWEKMEEIETIMRVHFKKRGFLMPRLSDPRFLFGNRQK
jgi:hypothetical protein